ncbi:hypothetical protein [Microvirga arsenatis]|uniref:Uncharacterized protein n=1 Tax=Microvirga arsenatis TaxID=2692265 RepID=A0ABW9YVQ7_9HYPH|nr:hypothetical protein [Microvirga arsenatis]NBJ13364.1 hypothetical protein [Microvirga arsenatis]NBJ24148.1 hypothetical protein [Microvirga arsenatis]
MTGKDQSAERQAAMENNSVKRYWVSWLADHGPFELHSPWWFSGMRASDDVPTVCAAVMAESEEAAREAIYACVDSRPAHIEFRFIEERPDDWTPFNSRFQRRDWMNWPDDDLPMSESEGGHPHV